MIIKEKKTDMVVWLYLSFAMNLLPDQRASVTVTDMAVSPSPGAMTES